MGREWLGMAALIVLMMVGLALCLSFVFDRIDDRNDRRLDRCLAAERVVCNVESTE